MSEEWDTWDDDQEGEYPYTDREEDVCSCGRPTVGEGCGQCGTPLCPMCFETGAGFCSGHPTADYEPEFDL